MSMLKKSFVALVLLCASLPATALAQLAPLEVRAHHQGFQFIAVLVGQTFLFTSQDGGSTCIEVQRISNTNVLIQDLRVIGTSSADFIYAVDRTLTFCGVTIFPVNNNGHFIHLDGGEGNNNIDGGTSAILMTGGSGNDIIQGANLGGVVIAGGPGRDQLFGRVGNSFIDAGSGDDIVCAHNANRLVAEMQGGSNTTANPGDRRCGRGIDATGGFETVSCAFPCM